MADSDVLVERRKPDPTIEALLTLASSVNSLHEKIDAFDEVKSIQITMRKDLGDHVEREEILFSSAFPGGDPDGHRRAHEAQILAAEKKAQFWERMAIKAGELTVWGFLVCLAFILVYFWNNHMPPSAQINLTVPK